MQRVHEIVLHCVLMFVLASPALAEMQYALMVRTYSCDAATLARVQAAVNLPPKEAVLLVTSESLCVEESSFFQFGEAALVPSAVEIVKPPASVDMAGAGYLVVIKQVIELGVVVSSDV